jgi:hypothetical protein
VRTLVIDNGKVMAVAMPALSDHTNYVNDVAVTADGQRV